jgi:putative ABC transport system substrate-binding protein
VDRRAFIVTGIAALAVSGAAEAQQAPMYKIGVLGAAAGPGPSTEAFRQGLRERGWIEGQNIRIEYRWAAGKVERFQPLAEELVKLGVNVIVVPGNKAIFAAKQATSAVPIMMAFSNDPVGSGLVASLARPEAM